MCSAIAFSRLGDAPSHSFAGVGIDRLKCSQQLQAIKKGPISISIECLLPRLDRGSIETESK
jgi:hypothetical protein